jgi:hypothetical protein
MNGPRGGLLAVLVYAMATGTAWLFYDYAAMSCFLPALFLAGMSVPGLVVALLATLVLRLPHLPIPLVVVVSSITWYAFGLVIARSPLQIPSKVALSAMTFVVMGFMLLAGYLLFWMVWGPR